MIFIRVLIVLDAVHAANPRVRVVAFGYDIMGFGSIVGQLLVRSILSSSSLMFLLLLIPLLLPLSLPVLPSLLFPLSLPVLSSMLFPLLFVA
eukprot:gene3846-biopygen4367